MVSTHLKNISQIGSFPQVGMKIKNIWNHRPVISSSSSSSLLQRQLRYPTPNFLDACCEASESRPIKCSHHLAPWRSQCCSLICRRPTRVPSRNCQINGESIRNLPVNIFTSTRLLSPKSIKKCLSIQEAVAHVSWPPVPATSGFCAANSMNPLWLELP